MPIGIQGQTLILAIEDPLDMPTLDALHNMTGYRVLPRVAPEITTCSTSTPASWAR